MKIKIILNSFFIMLILFIFSGCNKWLNVIPQTQVPQSVMFSNEQGFKDALIGVYTQMGGASIYGTNTTFGLADQLAGNYDNIYTSSGSLYQVSLYNFTDATIKANIANIWDSMYNCISSLNNILAQIDSKKAIFSGNNYNLVKGEALGLRALLHFDVLRMFGQQPAPYGDTTQKTIPYVTSFGITQTPFSSFGTVINDCITDLNAAKQLLQVQQTINTSNATDPFLTFTQNHLNYWAVQGLMARIYLYNGDKTNASINALAVINAGIFPFIQKSQITLYTDRTFSVEQLFSLYIYNLGTLQTSSFENSVSTNFTYQSTAYTNSVYESSSTDYRFLFCYGIYNSLRVPAKFWQDNPAIADGNTFSRIIPIIRLSEMYYIAAETAADPVTGVGYLNTVRINRGLTALATTITANTLQNEIMKEYRKEFVQEGQLYFYYKRNNINLNAVTNNPNTVPVGALPYIFPLPDNEVQFRH